MARRTNEFQTIRSEGGLLPPDLLRRVLDPKEKLPGTVAEDYSLPKGERINEVITQSWNRLRKHWAEFRAATETLPEGEPATGLTNDKWNLPLLRELDFGLLPTSAGPEVGGRSYAITRFFGPVPVHLVGCGLSLDRRAAGQRGAAAASPHGLVQDFLNRSPGHVWAIVSNGLRFRILRDNQALSRQSFLEFDLEAMFAGEVYSDFVLLWLITHATRFAPQDGDRPDTCWLEQWTEFADEQGTRALGELRGGVEKALEVLGEGFTSHPKNTAFRDGLRTEMIPLGDFHGQLLRVVYRLIFLFVAEDRTLDGQPLLHPRDDSDGARTARERYAANYGTDRLRGMAGTIKGSRHGDLWRQFQILVGALSGADASANVRQHLALPALGSFLWNPTSTSALNDAELTNYDFLEALRHLAFTRQGRMLRPVDYKNLGAEELGGVYESLLALTPQISANGARFTFAEFAGNERKTSGSYYTPDSLVQCLLDSALDPVVEEAIKGKTGAEAEKVILDLKICDPAVGSGHFLVRAAHRLARHLARGRALAQGESEPSPLLYQHALRDVIGHCLYGVDLNPMAAELCRVSLWLEALEPGKPLSFLDHHIRVGNSLLGTTPELIAAGLPDDAFNTIEGDDKKVCSALKKRNRQEREAGQQDMLYLMVAEREAEYNSIETRRRSIDDAPDDTIEEVQKKGELFGRLVVSPEYQHAQQVADAWCAAFVWKKHTGSAAEPITTDTIQRLTSDPKALTPSQVIEIERLSGQYQFFHFHLAFPEVFAQNGFDVSLGNPPWERIQVEAAQFFASLRPDLVEMKRSDRERAIEKLEKEDPMLFRAWQEQRRLELTTTAFLKSSGHYPYSTQKNVNSYAVFTELALTLIAPNGRLGLITQSGIATDDIMKPLFQFLVESQRLVSVFDFENREKLFPSVHPQLKFCLLTVSGAQQKSQRADFVFYATKPLDLSESDRHFLLSEADIAVLNPNTRTCPIFRSQQAADLCLAVYRRQPILCKEVEPTHNFWNTAIRRMFDMSYDSHLFVTKAQLRTGGAADSERGEFVLGEEHFFRLYEAKLLHQFDHRFATYQNSAQEDDFDDVPWQQKIEPNFCIAPRYWVRRSDYTQKMESTGWRCDWIVAFRMITNTTNERTAISTIVPQSGVGNSSYTLTFENIRAEDIACFMASSNSFCLDWLTRQKLAGSNLNVFILKQLPVLPPIFYEESCSWLKANASVRDWLLPRILELTFTAWDLEAFAQDCGWSGPPFRWDEERRFLLRCELDAAFFHLYLSATLQGDWKPARRCDGAVHDETPEQLAELIKHFPRSRDAVSYIMETFPIVKRKDIEKYGDYRTKLVILDIYDRMLHAIATGEPYKTLLDPPPADPRCCHLPRQGG